MERSFYEKQAILENWSFTELKRQKKPLFSYLPDREELRSELERLLNMANNEDV